MVKKNGLPEDDRGIAIITAAVLRRGRMLHHISLILSALVLAQFLLLGLYKTDALAAWPRILALVIVFGIAEIWYAARVALDADLFEAIGGAKLDATGLDRAMMRLGLTIEAKAGRGMEERARGGFRLLKLQGLCLLGQTVAFVAGTFPN
jgi:hypothetical protein